MTGFRETGVALHQEETETDPVYRGILGGKIQDVQREHIRFTTVLISHGNVEKILGLFCVLKVHGLLLEDWVFLLFHFTERGGSSRGSIHFWRGRGPCL